MNHWGASYRIFSVGKFTKYIMLAFKNGTRIFSKSSCFFVFLSFPLGSRVRRQNKNLYTLIQSADLQSELQP